MSESFHQHP
jgi:hypothetical protein